MIDVDEEVFEKIMIELQRRQTYRALDPILKMAVTELIHDSIEIYLDEVYKKIVTNENNQIH